MSDTSGSTNPSRRGLLAGAAALGALACQQVSGFARDEPPIPFRFCFNTSTVRGQQLPLVEEIQIAAEVGYQGIEPWVREIEEYQKSGGQLDDLRKRIEDANLTVESAIGFASWIVDDPQQRAQGLETARREMDLVRQIGGTRIAAPPAGASARIDLEVITERYRQLLAIGDEIGVVPQLELWGPSPAIHRLSEAAFIAIESAHPKACVLPDVYHLYKGGSDVRSLHLIDGGAIHAFHMNDYPANPPRETITDADRVYPGDGIAPWRELFRTLHTIGFRGALSLELFNREYWRLDPKTVARRGLEKLRVAVESAFA